MSQVILFDLDGTLTASGEGITKCVQYALEKMGIVEDDLKKLECFIGPPLKNSFMKYGELTEEQAEQAIVYYRERYEEKGMFENSLYPKIPDLLELLQINDKVLAVASAKPEKYVRQILEHFEIASYFQTIVGSEMNGKKSTKAEVIEEALARLGMQTERDKVIMVGDRSDDVLGARSCGVQCVGAAYGYGGEEELRQAGAVYIAETVEDLAVLASPNDEETTEHVESIREFDFGMEETAAAVMPAEEMFVSGGQIYTENAVEAKAMEPNNESDDLQNLSEEERNEALVYRAISQMNQTPTENVLMDVSLEELGNMLDTGLVKDSVKDHISDEDAAAAAPSAAATSVQEVAHADNTQVFSQAFLEEVRARMNQKAETPQSAETSESMNPFLEVAASENVEAAEEDIIKAEPPKSKWLDEEEEPVRPRKKRTKTVKMHPMHHIWRWVYPIGLYFAVSIAVTLSAGIYFAIRLLTGSEPYDTEMLSKMIIESSLAQTLITNVLVCVICGFFYRIDEKKREQGILGNGKTEKWCPAWAWFAVVGLAIAGCQFLNDLINMLKLNEMFPEYSNVSNQIFANQSVWLMLVTVGIAAPMAEELIFRGLLFQRMKDWVKPWFAVVFSAVLFGLYHGNVVQFIYAFIMGMVFALVYKRTGILWTAIVAHLAANFWSMLGYGVIEMLTAGSAAASWIVLILSGILFVALTIVLCRQKKEQAE